MWVCGPEVKVGSAETTPPPVRSRRPSLKPIGNHAPEAEHREDDGTTNKSNKSRQYQYYEIIPNEYPDYDRCNGYNCYELSVISSIGSQYKTSGNRC
jgi:hypothetical protein